MYIVREIMHCKPGKVRAMVEKFQAINKLIKDAGAGQPFRIMTDVSGERFWTVVAETDVASLEQHEAETKKMMADPKFQEAMKGYHDLVHDGRREIYTLEK